MPLLELAIVRLAACSRLQAAYCTAAHYTAAHYTAAYCCPHQVRLLEVAAQLLGSGTALLAALPTQHGAALEAQQVSSE